RVVLFGAEERARLGVENLEGDAARLREDVAAVLRVGVVAVVGSFVDEALSARVDDDAKRVALAGQPVGQLAAAAVPPCTPLPGDAVTRGPVAEARRAGLDREVEDLARVRRSSAH